MRLRLEDRRLDVAEVLPVDLQRRGHVAPDHDPRGVVEDDHALPGPNAAEERDAQPRDVASTHRTGRDDVEPEVERRPARHVQANATRVGVGIAVGDEREGRPARIDGNKSSPAETEVARADVDPRTEFSGRTPQEDALTQYLANFPGVDLKNLGIFGVLASEKNFKGNLIGVLPTPAQLRFILVWTAPFGTDVDLSVRSPLGEVVSIDNPQVKSSGRHLGNGVANKNGLGQETVIWEQFFPPGNYTVRGRLQDKGVKGTVGARLFVDKNPGQKDNQQLDDFSVDLSSKSPAFRRDVKAR